MNRFIQASLIVLIMAALVVIVAATANSDDVNPPNAIGLDDGPARPWTPPPSPDPERIIREESEIRHFCDGFTRETVIREVLIDGEWEYLDHHEVWTFDADHITCADDAGEMG